MMTFVGGGETAAAAPQQDGPVDPVKLSEREPLEVPVFRLDQYNEVIKAPKDSSKFNPLYDSYIRLEDGSVLSLKEWVLAGNNPGLSDEDLIQYYKTTLAALRQAQDLTQGNLVNTRPTIPYKTGTTPAPPIQIVQQFLRYFIPGRDRSWTPATSGGTFAPTAKIGGRGNDAILFQRQISEAVHWISEDLREHGTMMNMLDDYKKRLEEEEK